MIRTRKSKTISKSTKAQEGGTKSKTLGESRKQPGSVSSQLKISNFFKLPERPEARKTPMGLGTALHKPEDLRIMSSVNCYDPDCLFMNRDSNKSETS